VKMALCRDFPHKIVRMHCAKGGRMGKETEKNEKKEVEEAEVEPIKPFEKRGGKSRTLLDTCE
jgi:hypothetical protein